MPHASNSGSKKDARTKRRVGKPAPPQVNAQARKIARGVLPHHPLVIPCGVPTSKFNAPRGTYSQFDLEVIDSNTDAKN